MGVLDSITNEQLIEATLAWVNEERGRYRRPPLSELPKGLVDHNRECPVARALEHDGLPVITSHEGCMYQIPGHLVSSLFPDDVVLFVRRFDRGEIPELALS